MSNNRSLEHKIMDAIFKDRQRKPINESIENIEEGRASGSKYHVSVNYTKNNFGNHANAEHVVKHYKIQKPKVSDEYLAAASKSVIKEHPTHKDMLSKGFRINPDNGIHASDNEKYAKQSANEVHTHHVSLSSMLAKKYPDSGSMYEENNEEYFTGDENLNEEIASGTKERESEEIVARPDSKKKDLLNKQQQIQKKIIDEENVEEGVLTNLGLKRGKSLGSDMKRFTTMYHDPREVKKDTEENRRQDPSLDQWSVDRMTNTKITKGSPAELQGRLSKRYLKNKKNIDEAIEKDKARVATVKKIKKGGNPNIILNPELQKANSDVDTVVS